MNGSNAGSTLVIGNAAIDQTGGGTIQALGSSSVRLGGVTVTGGILTTTGSSSIQSLSAYDMNFFGMGGVGNVTLDGTSSAVTNSGSFVVQDSSTTTLAGTINDTGTITLNPYRGSNTYLNVTGTASLQGGGHVVLNGGNALNAIISGGGTLTNADNTISGNGQLGNGSLSLVNEAQGVVNANNGGIMVLNAGAGTVTNNGLIEATNSSSLLIGSSVGGTGTISAGTGSIVHLGGDATISGNTLSTSGGAIWVEQDYYTHLGGSGATFDGSSHAVSNTGYVEVRDTSVLTIAGAINNSGTIALNSYNGDTTTMSVNGGATLTGGGTVNLEGAWYSGGTISGSGTLTNTDNTITGYGQVGNGLTSIANGGSIMSSNGNLAVNAASVTNTGTLEAGTGTTLTVNAALSNYSAGTLTGGTYVADKNSDLNIGSIGGITTNAATITLNGPGSSFGAANSIATNDGNFNVLNGQGFGTAGGLTNYGIITVAGGSGLTVNGTMLNAVGATLTVDHSAANFVGGFTNNGVFVSDPSSLSFTTLTEGNTGVQLAAPGDRYIVTGDFLNHSTRNTLWNTSGATLDFADGASSTHQLLLTGADRGTGAAGWVNNFAWGTLQIDAGQTVTLGAGIAGSGALALYIGDLLGADLSGDTITNIIGNGFDLFYDPTQAANAYLNGASYMLADGGELLASIPGVTEPGSLALLAPAVAAMFGRRRLRSGHRQHVA